MRYRNSAGKFISSSRSHQGIQVPRGDALIEHAGAQAVGLFAGIDPTLLADTIQSASASVARIVHRGGSVQVWMQSTTPGVGERIAEALTNAGVVVELRASV